MKHWQLIGIALSSHPSLVACNPSHPLRSVDETLKVLKLIEQA